MAQDLNFPQHIEKKHIPNTESWSVERGDNGEYVLREVFGFEFHESDTILTLIGLALILIFVYCLKCFIDLQFAKRLEVFKQKQDTKKENQFFEDV